MSSMNMDPLAKTIYSAITTLSNKFIDDIVSEFKLDKEKLVAVWNKSNGDEIKIIDSSSSTKKTAVKKPAKTKSEDDGKKCQYHFIKGEKEGEVCGCKVSDESTTGSFCKKHLGQEKEKKPSAKKPSKAGTKAKTTKAKNDEKESESKAVQKVADTAPVFNVKLNTWRNYELVIDNKNVGLVFDRETEKVRGRQSPNSKDVLPLTAEDIETCRELGLQYNLPVNMTSNADKEEDDDDEIQDSDEEEDEDEDEDN